MALADQPFADAGKLSDREARELLEQLDDWSIVEGDVAKLQKTYTFPDFMAALGFCNKIGAVAEGHGHHPLITFTWGSATVRWWSHSLGGLTKNDFIMAAKTDTLAH